MPSKRDNSVKHLQELQSTDARVCLSEFDSRLPLKATLLMLRRVFNFGRVMPPSPEPRRGFFGFSKGNRRTPHLLVGAAGQQR
mmetsp:Transcript_2354/g.7240  ORF Transcript_2354/g.7240 Transcript_2354/m.7240 type:complete len:83 (-) Transcript_2354:545-793(-)